MTDLQQYLDGQLSQTKQAMQIWLDQQKQTLQSSLNQEMMRQIAQAEAQAEHDKKRFVDLFKNQMAELERRRKSESMPVIQRMYDSIEKSDKAQLERNLKLVETQFKSFVEYCMKNVK